MEMYRLELLSTARPSGNGVLEPVCTDEQVPATVVRAGWAKLSTTPLARLRTQLCWLSAM